jgi:cell division protein FtsB
MPPARTNTAAPRGQTRRAAQTHGPPKRARTGSPTPRVRPRRAPAPPLRIRWERVGRVVLLGVLAVVVGLYVQQALAYWSVRTQANQQQSIARRLSRQNARLVRQEKLLNDPATIVRGARALGMVKPGERPYVVTGLPRG